MQLTRLAEAFRSLGYPVAEGEPMSRHTSFKVGGPADMFVTVPDGKGAAAVLYRCREAGIPVFVMGNGSNLLVSDEGIEGVVLKIETTAPPASGEAGLSVPPACRSKSSASLPGIRPCQGWSSPSASRGRSAAGCT